MVDLQDAMVQECLRSGCLKRKDLSNLAVMDASRLDKVREVSSAVHANDLM